MSWKYGVMRGYGKVKIAGVKFGASIGENWLTDIDLLLSIDSLISTDLMIWLVNHIRNNENPVAGPG